MAIDLKSSRARRWAIGAVALASAVAYCAPPGTFRPITFEFTGTVRDQETKEPIEGAYVVATYDVFKSGFDVSSRNCMRTKGMFTGNDGKFHFPIERLDGMSPSNVTAIKPGYYGNKREAGDPREHKQQSPAAYTNRDHYLVKQDPEKPNFRYGDGQEQCIHAETREAVEASVQFLKIKLSEVTRLGGEAWRIRNIGEEIARLEALPSATKGK